MSLLAFCEWLEHTQAAVLVRESTWGFQILVALHILGLGCSVGMLVWLDLRLLGLSLREVPVSQVYRRVMPWALTGFAVMFTTGGLLFAGFATSAYANGYFRAKAAAIVLAGVNAIVYHRLTERGIAAWDASVAPPWPARMAGLLSIALWTIVVLSGRMIAYTLY